MPYAGTSEFGDYAGELDTSVSVTFDRIPKGEAELRLTTTEPAEALVFDLA